MNFLSHAEVARLNSVNVGETLLIMTQLQMIMTDGSSNVWWRRWAEKVLVLEFMPSAGPVLGKLHEGLVTVFLPGRSVSESRENQAACQQTRGRVRYEDACQPKDVQSEYCGRQR